MTEPYKATITIEINSPTRESAPEMFKRALEAIGSGCPVGKGMAGKKGSYRYSIAENQSGAPYPMPEILAKLRDEFKG
jgi:hypothetical protein